MNTKNYRILVFLVYSSLFLTIQFYYSIKVLYITIVRESNKLSFAILSLAANNVEQSINYGQVYQV